MEPFKPPVVDSLSVRVVIDSVFDQFMPKATHPMCTIEHVGRIRHNLNSTLAGERTESRIAAGPRAIAAMLGDFRCAYGVALAAVAAALNAIAAPKSTTSACGRDMRGVQDRTRWSRVWRLPEGRVD